jgi:hypothetical protein
VRYTNEVFLELGLELALENFVLEVGVAFQNDCANYYVCGSLKSVIIAFDRHEHSEYYYRPQFLGILEDLVVHA